MKVPFKDELFGGPAPPAFVDQGAPKDGTARTKKRPGWHYSILGGASVTTFSLICNVILLIIGLTKYDSHTGRGQLSSGSCNTIPSLDTGFHIGINILSALMLGASNAAMQVLSAPTRASLDKLHAAGNSADIGLNGFRNLKIMTPLRRVLWVILLVSSVPLHLLYNSVIVSTVAQWDWYAFVVTPDFIGTANPTVPNWNTDALQALQITNEKVQSLQDFGLENELEQVSASECQQIFSAAPLYGIANVLMVVEHVPFPLPTNSGTILGVYSSADTASGTDGLHEFYNISFAVANNAFNGANLLENVEIPENNLLFHTNGSETQFLASSWPLFWNHTRLSSMDGPSTPQIPRAPTPDFSIVDHCLISRVDDFCSVDTLPTIQAIVVFINSMKLCCLLLIIYKVKEQPIITLGDGISSFITNPDPITSESGPIDLLRIKRSRKAGLGLPRWHFSGKRYWWFRGVSPIRWGWTAFFCLSYLAVGFIFMFGFGGPRFESAFNKYDPSSSETTDLISIFGQFGGFANNTFGSTVNNIVMANVFQLILSIAYFQYNGVVTSMLLSREWTNFARYRKGLRVSSPRGAQRRTFWLSLPYAYNIPLLTLASLLHWMMSETIFYQELNIFDGSKTVKSDAFGQPDPTILYQARDGVFLDLGSLGVLNFFALACILLVLGLGFRSYPGGIPVVRSNSLALAHACYVRPEQPEDPYQPIAWGIRARLPTTTVPVQGPTGMTTGIVLPPGAVTMTAMTTDNVPVAVDVGLSSHEIEVVDPSALKFNPLERAVYRFKKNSHARISRAAAWLLGKRRKAEQDVVVYRPPPPVRSMSNASTSTIHQPLRQNVEKIDGLASEYSPTTSEPVELDGGEPYRGGGWEDREDRNDRSRWSE